MARCAKCPATIVWAKSERTGKPAPFDAEPVGDGLGRFAIVEGVAVKYGPVHAAAGLPRYVSHFSTCPAATFFRGGGR